MRWIDAASERTLDEMVGAFQRHHAALAHRLEALDDGGWQRTGKFFENGHLIIEATMGELLWLFLFDAIHHRGQLSTYIRPMGGKVPSIYGPSADDPGAA